MRKFPILDRPPYRYPLPRDERRRVSFSKNEYNKCIKRIKNELIQDYVDEFGISRTTAIEMLEERDWIWNFDHIQKEFEEEYYQFIVGEDDRTIFMALPLVKENFPYLMDILEDSVYVFYCNEQRLEYPGVFVPQIDPTDRKKRCNYAILIDEGAVRAGTDFDIAGILAHEAMHLDYRINPERYNAKKDEASMWIDHTFGIVEKKIDERIKQKNIPLDPIEGWKRDISFGSTVPEIVLKIFACMNGKPCPEGYVKT